MKLSFLDYWKGTMAYALLLSRAEQGKPNFTVSSEANRRAAICKDCPQHKKPEQIKDKGWFEGWARGAFRKRVEGRTTPLDKDLGICKVCKCDVPTIVHLHNDLIRVGLDPSEYPSACWKVCLAK